MENAEPPLRGSLVADAGCRSQSSSLRPNQSAPPFLGWVGLDAAGVLCLEPASPLRSVLPSAKNLLQDREEGSKAGQVARPKSPLALRPRPPLLGGDCEFHTKELGMPGALRGQRQAPGAAPAPARAAEPWQLAVRRTPPDADTWNSITPGTIPPVARRTKRQPRAQASREEPAGPSGLGVSSRVVCYLFVYSAIACMFYCSVAAACKD